MEKSENFSIKQNHQSKGAQLQLFRHENYSFQVLTQKDKNQAMMLLASEFIDEEPLTQAYMKKYKDVDKQGSDAWFDFWKMFLDNSLSKQMCVGAFDLSNNRELVGVSAAKDLNITEVFQNFEDRFLKSFNLISSIIEFEEQLFKQIQQKYQQILEKKGSTMDIWGVAIKKTHRRKQLLHRMMKGSEQLGKQRGFNYAFCYATNLKTGIALSKLNYEKISQLQNKSIKFKDENPFTQTDEVSFKANLWMKELK